jgi:hypothetical protein
MTKTLEQGIDSLAERINEACRTIDKLREQRALLREALEGLVDPAPCDYDHHGFCQAHGHLTKGTCPQAFARLTLIAVSR